MLQDPSSPNGLFSPTQTLFQKQPECDRCCFYTRNPLLYCAVHPMGSDGVCSTFENDPAVDAEIQTYQQKQQEQWAKESN
ncbi:hypothetical protein ACQ4M4_16405 [Leptolyngbya sp. AN02str]|uniref:hypothetical protein n=1 Tax=Leptolyngbya sp. AN02str TaxID=3423363 RepID=UPI003D31CBD6